MVNTVDIPQGILYRRWVNDDPQFTSCSVVGDLHNRVHYFRTWNNHDIRKVSLEKIDFGGTTFRSDSLFTPPNYRKFEFRQRIGTLDRSSAPDRALRTHPGTGRRRWGAERALRTRRPCPDSTGSYWAR